MITISSQQQKNEKGQVVYEKFPSGGLEWWYEYNSNGVLIHLKCSNGYERKWNDHRVKIYFKNEEGLEEWYDDSGDLIHRKDPDGSEGKVNHLQYANGNEYKFDEMGNLLYRKRVIDGREYEYDAQGNLIDENNSYYRYNTNSFEYEAWYENDIEISKN